MENLQELDRVENRRPVDSPWDALENYENSPGVNERKDLSEHAVRVLSLVEAFDGENIPKAALRAAILHDASDRFYNESSTKHTTERREAARLELADYLTSPKISTEEMHYMASILADMVRTEVASGQHRRDMAEYAAAGSERYMDAVEMIADHYQGEIPEEAWEATEPLLDPEHMREFLHHTNVESLEIKACELLDNMKNPSSARESAKLQDVLEAESFYAPIVEAMGRDGLASALRSQAHIMRLEGQNRHDCVEQARRVHDTVASAGFRSILGSVFGEGANSDLVPAVSMDGTTGQMSFYIGEFVVERPDGKLLAGNYRLKGVGSLANKLVRYDGEMPMDVVGLTVISKDQEDVAQDFANFVSENIDGLRGDDDGGVLVGKPARSKEKSVYIQGTTEYVETMTRELFKRGIKEDELQISVESEEETRAQGYKGYEVAKATFMLNCQGIEVPCEMQFLTKEERKRSRLEEVSHMAFKYLSQFPEIDLSEKKRIATSIASVASDIYDRVSHMNPNSLGVNKHSEVRAADFLRKLGE